MLIICIYIFINTCVSFILINIISTFIDYGFRIYLCVTCCICPKKNYTFINIFLNHFMLCDSALILHWYMYRKITSVRDYDITLSLGCIWLYWLRGRAVCQTVEWESSVCCNLLFSRWLWWWLTPSMLCIQAVQMTGSRRAMLTWSDCSVGSERKLAVHRNDYGWWL